MSDVTIYNNYSTTSDITSITNAQVRNFTIQLADSLAMSTVMHFYTQASEETGSVVIFSPRYACLPCLQGDDGQAVPLYEFVEALDGIVDYDRIKSEFPNLSFGQIAGAIDFLRRLAQFNTQNANLDSLEEKFIEGDPEFQARIRAVLDDQEQTRVLAAE